MEFAVSSVPGPLDWHPHRGATRYPLHLRVIMVAGGRQMEGLTVDMSASGVLFRFGEALPAGQQVEFLLEIPSGALESSATAAVHCTGRVVRSYWKQGRAYTAAVIDEYRFQ